MRGEYTCEEIAESYAYKLLTHCGPDRLNHYTEVCVLEALSDAAKWDLLIKKQPEIAGDLKGYPLLGVPISVKDSFNMKGYHTTWGGLARLCGKMGIAESDCALVAVLRNAGAVVLARGNMPQLALAIESNNDVFGVSRNPLDPERACGGSSGGDAGMVAAGGCVAADRFITKYKRAERK